MKIVGWIGVRGLNMCPLKSHTEWFWRTKAKPSPPLHRQDWMCNLVFCININQHMCELPQAVYHLISHTLDKEQHLTGSFDCENYNCDQTIGQASKLSARRPHRCTCRERAQDRQEKERLQQRWKSDGTTAKILKYRYPSFTLKNLWQFIT